MNKLEKILELSKSKGFKSLFEECDCNIGEDCPNCSFTKVLGHNHCNLDHCAEELLEEYEEPHKLTKRERAFCEYAQEGWIAREESGSLYYFAEKPTTKDIYGHWVDGGNFSLIIEGLFPFITWEDEEPYSVEDLLTWEVEE